MLEKRCRFVLSVFREQTFLRQLLHPKTIDTLQDLFG